MKFFSSLAVLGAAWAQTSNSTGSAACCNKCDSSAGLEKYFSIAKNPEAKREQCGEACIKPSQYGTFHIFEPHLKKAVTASPCKDAGFVDYLDTDTHGQLYNA